MRGTVGAHIGGRWRQETAFEGDKPSAGWEIPVGLVCGFFYDLCACFLTGSRSPVGAEEAAVSGIC